ncbi:DUF1259 domain-containing protein, partial [Ligilactobacillus salivarius]
RLMFMHFESIDKPLNFARKVREALRVLTTKTVRAVPKTDGDMIERHGLCDEFNDILVGTMHTFENGICTVMRYRTNIKPVVLGRHGRSFLLIPQMFSFESMTKDGRALCSGETVILQKEINPFISVLRKHDLTVTSLHNHWLFDKPR